MSTTRATLIAAVTALADTCEAKEKELTEKEGWINTRESAVKVGEGILLDRCKQLTNREQAVSQIRDIAAQRKARIETLEMELKDVMDKNRQLVQHVDVLKKARAGNERTILDLIEKKNLLQEELDRANGPKVDVAAAAN